MASTKYAELDTLLHYKGNPLYRALHSRKVGNNTYAERRGALGDGDIAIRLHDTDVLTFHADNTVTLNTGGWLTVTTKARINEFLPAGFRVYSERGVWSVRLWAPGFGSWADGTSVPFADGLRLQLAAVNGQVVVNPEILPDIDKLNRENAETKKAIKKYVALYTDERIAELYKGTLEIGRLGDCLYCLAGGSFGGTEHLTSHIEESYTLFSLMWNAVEAKGYRDPDFIIASYPAGVRRAIGTYLRKALLQGVQVTV